MRNIRKLLASISFIAVLLLNQPIISAQDFGDEVKEQAIKCSNKQWSFDLLGSPTNDYTLSLPKKLSCLFPNRKKQSYSLLGQAQLGANLSIGGKSSAIGPAAQDSATVTANDTLVLNPPDGFNGTSVEIGLQQSYQLEVQGANQSNQGSAIACFQWTGEPTPTCFPLGTNGEVIKTLNVPIMVNKTNQGFRLNLQLSGVAGSVTITGSQVFAFMAIGSPTISVPPGWTFTWASGEP